MDRYGVKRGEFTLHLNAFREQGRSFRYLFTADADIFTGEDWKNKLSSIIYNDVKKVLDSVTFLIYAWHLRMKVQFEGTEHPEFTSIRCFETDSFLHPPDSLLDWIFGLCYSSLLTKITYYEEDTQCVVDHPIYVEVCVERE